MSLNKTTKMFTLTVPIDDHKLIRDFYRKEGFNFSRVTVKLWKVFLQQYNEKNINFEDLFKDE